MMKSTCMILLLLPALLSAQTFTRVAGPGNPILTDPGSSYYAGASWVDFDGDNDPDLFINNDRLYRNDGNGDFERVWTSLGSLQPPPEQSTGCGNSWADYDNDGDLDCYIAGARSYLYRNDGGDFTPITTGVIGDGTANRGWACAWGDYDNDGYVDLAVVHPAGFVPGAPTTNHLFHNSGPPDFRFERVTNAITARMAPFTVGTWSDFDRDGDLDFFIGTGPADGTTGPDYLYRNMLHESGMPTFERIAEGALAAAEHDGQVWSWIDFDNDLDLDAFVTNWGAPLGGLPNRLFRHDDTGFAAVDAGALTSDAAPSLGVAWADFDNDADIDCYVANDNNMPDHFYRNDGAAGFTALRNMPFGRALTHRGATAGDYDGDGDMDIIAEGPGTATELYRNDTENGNHWIVFHCIGTRSNRAAIGARLFVRAVVNGRPLWQMREISAQNSFNGQHSLLVHVGLGDAGAVDSVIVRWPSGEIDTTGGFACDRVVTIVENGASGSVVRRDEYDRDGALEVTATPNPFGTSSSIAFVATHPARAVVTITDMPGRVLRTFVVQIAHAGPVTVRWDGVDDAGVALPAGCYLIRVAHGTHAGSVPVMLSR